MANSYYDHTTYPATGASGSSAALRAELDTIEAGFDAVEAAITTPTITGDLTFSGTGNRITGDFSNATLANRVMFQSSTANDQTTVSVIPTGTSTASGLIVHNTSTPGNSHYGRLRISSSEVILESAFSGTPPNTFIPMTFYTGGTERLRIDTSGNVLVKSVAGLGYGTGAGGTVTQATSRVTEVTLHKPTGSIVLFSKAATAGLVDSFTVTNSLIAATDTVILSMQSGTVNATDIYIPVVSQVSAGSFRVSLYTPAATASEAPVINFAVIKGVTS